MGNSSPGPTCDCQPVPKPCGSSFPKSYSAKPVITGRERTAHPPDGASSSSPTPSQHEVHISRSAQHLIDQLTYPHICSRDHHALFLQNHLHKVRNHHYTNPECCSVDDFQYAQRRGAVNLPHRSTALFLLHRLDSRALLYFPCSSCCFAINRNRSPSFHKSPISPLVSSIVRSGASRLHCTLSLTAGTVADTECATLEARISDTLRSFLRFWHLTAQGQSKEPTRQINPRLSESTALYPGRRASLIRGVVLCRLILYFFLIGAKSLFIHTSELFRRCGFSTPFPRPRFRRGDNTRLPPNERRSFLCVLEKSTQGSSRDINRIAEPSFR